jgi:hypothetical protein
MRIVKHKGVTRGSMGVSRTGVWIMRLPLLITVVLSLVPVRRVLVPNPWPYSKNGGTMATAVRDYGDPTY